MASKSFRSISNAPAGKAMPSSRYFSAPQSNSTNSNPALNTSFTRRSTRIDSRVTSIPIPSPGTTAIRFIVTWGCLCSDQRVVLRDEGLQVRLFVFRKVHKNLPAVRVGNVIRKILEKLMRAAFEIHRDVQGVDIARLVFDLDL